MYSNSLKIFNAAEQFSFVFYSLVIQFALNLYQCVPFYLQPRFVSDTDEVELAKQMQRLEEENREISGDEDSEGEQNGTDGEEEEEDKDKAAEVVE